jgi:hypothetical protein
MGYSNISWDGNILTARCDDFRLAQFVFPRQNYCNSDPKRTLKFSLSLCASVVKNVLGEKGQIRIRCLVVRIGEFLQLGIGVD